MIWHVNIERKNTNTGKLCTNALHSLSNCSRDIRCAKENVKISNLLDEIFALSKRACVFLKLFSLRDH